MKKVILGSIMFLTGVISIALILAGSMANEWMVNGKLNYVGFGNMKEFCTYLSIGETKARELLHGPANEFTVRIGKRLYAHRGNYMGKTNQRYQRTYIFACLCAQYSKQRRYEV